MGFDRSFFDTQNLFWVQINTMYITYILYMRHIYCTFVIPDNGNSVLTLFLQTRYGWMEFYFMRHSIAFALYIVKSNESAEKDWSSGTSKASRSQHVTSYKYRKHRLLMASPWFSTKPRRKQRSDTLSLSYVTGFHRNDRIKLRRKKKA